MNLMDLFVKISVDDQASSQVETLGGKLKNGLATAAKVGASAIGAVTAATGALYTGITAAAGSVASYGDNIDKMSQKMGMSAEAYQEWDAVMQHSGTSIESLQAGMKTLANAVESGNNAFERLGISQEEIAKMSNEELFSATITALQNVENETERTYLAGQLLGRGATELGALLNTSAEDTQAMKDRVHELGGVMSNEAVKASARYQDSLQDMKTSFSGLKNSLIADFLPGMATVMDGIASLVTGEDGAQATISSGISQMIESINSSLPRFLDAGKQIVESIFQAITQNLPQMVSGGIEMLMSIVDGISSNVSSIAKCIMDIISVILEKLAKSIPELLVAGVNIVLGLVQGLIEGIPAIIAALPTIITELVNGLLGAIPQIIQAGITLLTALVGALPEIIQAIVNAIPLIIDGIINAIVQSIPLLIQAGIDLLLALIAALPEIITAIVDAIPQIISGITDALIGNIDKIIDAGVQLFVALIENLPTIIVEIVKAVPDIIAGIVKAFGDLAWKIVEIGGDLIKGIWQGIKDAGAWLWEKITGFFDGIVGGIKDFLGIHSPSRVFADMGKNMALGIGEGWDNQYDSIKKDIESGMNFTASVSTTGKVPYAIAQSPAQAQNYVLDALKNINFSIYLDGKTLVGKLAPTIDEQMGTLHIARARGV